LITLSTIQEAQQKDVRAQRMLFDAYGKIFHRLARRYLSDPEKAEDAVANSFYVILEKIKSCHFIAVPPFEVWMKRIVINECLQVLRKDKLFQNLIDTAHENCYAEDITIEHLTAEKILQIIAELPIGYRTVFNLYEIEGYTHQEIAEMLGISAGTSKSQLSKAKGLLQKKLIELDPLYAKRKVI
jgi:RNA polymerase sigma factor (sigma-70 family)